MSFSDDQRKMAYEIFLRFHDDPPKVENNLIRRFRDDQRNLDNILLLLREANHLLEGSDEVRAILKRAVLERTVEHALHGMSDEPDDARPDLTMPDIGQKLLPFIVPKKLRANRGGRSR